MKSTMMPVLSGRANRKPLRIKLAALLVTGWPFALPGDPSKGVLPESGDGAFGRLACPALTRLNLKEKKSEPLLLRSVDLESPRHWRLTLKSDLHWWSGKEVSAIDLAAFVRERICPAAVSALGKDIVCPAHEVIELPSESNRGQAPAVRIVWQSQPSFGPFVMNEVPFSRAAEGSGFECAGLYRYRMTSPRSAELVPSPGYQQKRPALQIKSILESSLPEKSRVDFTFGSGMRTGQACTREALVPSVIGILWNENSSRNSGLSPAVRKALTQVLPRGELLRAGALGLGDLVTSFVPRQHPGYNGALRIRPYSVEEASAALEKAGWKREKADAPRINTKTGKPVVVKLLLESEESPGTDLIQKVIGDSFALLGIQSEFTRRDSGEADGVLGNFTVPWPSMNLTGQDAVSHSHLLRRFIGSEFARQGDIRQMFQQYSQSLTRQVPDFAVLQRIHEKLYDFEVFSPVFQMGSCLDRSAQAPAKLDFTDPDWLRLLVL